jgi:peptide/nickel transport system substrate-binding protein
MKKKTLGLVIIFLFMTSLAMAAEKPQYGGELTVLHRFVSSSDPASADVADGFWTSTVWLGTIADRPFLGDFEKYGPRGTDEYQFECLAYIPEQYIRGNLIESWEVDFQKIVWHIRKGVMFTGNKKIGMKPREYTAEDCAFSLNYYLNSPPGKLARGYIADVKVIDKYTVEMTFDHYDLTWMFYLGYEDRAAHMARETYEAGAAKWENQVSTGPWMIEEYVPGSYMSYVKNPMWWDTTTIDGVVYDDIPFIDKMVWPIIPDVSTQIAALRTGKVDYFWNPNSPYWKALDKAAPELKSHKFVGVYSYGIQMRVDEPPFNDKNVRHAMSMATDREAFASVQDVGPLPKYFGPVWIGHPETLRYKWEDLPKDIQQLYEYHPDKAKELLKAARYPDGFKVDVYTSTAAEDVDRASLLKDMWAQVGVDVNIVSLDPVTLDGFIRARPVKFHGALVRANDYGNPAEVILRKETTHHWNTNVYHNPWYDEQMAQLKQTVDIPKRQAMIKELGLFLSEETLDIQTDPRMEAVYWWPWVKNYFGEYAVADNDFQPVLAKAWLDLKLKKEMGY